MAGAFRSPADAKVIGGNLPTNAGARDLSDISSHNSPTLVRNPTNGANLAMANRIDSPAFSCALNLSFDAGANWSSRPLPVPGGEEPKCYAPEVAFGVDGTLYVSFVTLRGTGNLPNRAWLLTSTDGGRTLSKPARISPVGSLGFQIRLVADPSTARRLYVVWLQASSTATLGFPEPGYPIQFARSDDGGTTWQGPQSITRPSRKRVVGPALVAGRTGELFAVYLDLGDDKIDYEGAHGGKGGPAYPGTWSLVLVRSRDRGATWTESVVDSGVVPTERFISFIPPLPSLAVDDSARRVYVGFHDGRLGDADVMVWTSDDAGVSFGAPSRVNDTPRYDGTSQYLPKLAVAPDARLDVLYYDRRNDPANVMNQVSLQSSFDGGSTFTRRLRLSDRPFDSRIGFGSEREMPDLGNKLALLSTKAQAYGVWTDTRVGTRASNKQDLVRALVRISRPQGLSRPTELTLQIGGALLATLGVLLFLRSARSVSSANLQKRD